MIDDMVRAAIANIANSTIIGMIAFTSVFPLFAPIFQFILGLTGNVVIGTIFAMIVILTLTCAVMIVAAWIEESIKFAIREFGRFNSLKQRERESHMSFLNKVRKYFRMSYSTT